MPIPQPYVSSVSAFGATSAASILARPSSPMPVLSGRLKPRRRTILFAEDDAIVRPLTQALLGSAGYEVWGCCDGLKALHVHSLVRPVEVLVSDIEMPFVSGIELALALTTRQPGLRVVLVSGCTPTQEMGRLIAENGWTFLQKPARVNALIEAIEGRSCGPSSRGPFMMRAS